MQLQTIADVANSFQFWEYRVRGGKRTDVVERVVSKVGNLITVVTTAGATVQIRRLKKIAA